MKQASVHSWERGHRSARCRGRRRTATGFSVIEVLISISIVSVLMTSVMFSLQASFHAYQETTESASRDTIARLTMNALLSMIRTGTEFGPIPYNIITNPIVESDYIEFITARGDYVRVEYVEAEETLYVVVDPDGAAQREVLASGVPPIYDGETRLAPFTLHYVIGPRLYRATVDLMFGDDSAVDLSQEGAMSTPTRLISSVMPRNN